MTMDKNLSFTLKDLIMIVTIIISVIGTYYMLNTKVLILENDNTRLNTKLSEVTSELKAYKGLPSQVGRLEKMVENNAKLTEAIYLGLIAKGIIKPKSIQ